ncbi:immunoglobulin superfamily member 3-like [Talpa occidentalis]|uniref:immunoglobulin superfamily member 3-like n=1 Tax=Talpa occidentalis TaxID=50954 RepID=UPI0023F75A56|nr:immunoglobulin superfamily member 3-like [Talpa occidentalis]
MGPDGVFGPEGGPWEGRLRFQRPSPLLFRLTVLQASPQDTGHYSCRVEEWLPSPQGDWYLLAEEESAPMGIRVLDTGVALQVILVVPNATVPEKAAFQLDCSIMSRSSQDSRFAVACFSLRTNVIGKKGSPGLAGQEEQEEDQEEEQGEDPTERTSLLRVGPDGVFGPEGGPWEGRLRFQRPSLLLFRLTVLQASPQDTGNYSCRVEEWLPSPQGGWYLLEEEESAPISIRVLDTGVFLQVILVAPNATVPEKAAFQLDCSIASRSSQDSRFAVAWFSLRTNVSGKMGSPGLAGQEEQEEDQEEEQGEDPTERRVLLSVGPDGVFGPEGGPWEDRLRFQRPSLLLFRLTVLQASPQDTGNYSCRVEERLPSPQGGWYLLAKEESAPISIRVLDTGSTLQSSICSNDALFYFVFFYPFPICGILITILLVCFKSRNFKAYR